MSGRFTRSWSEAGASDARPLLRASSPLKTEKQPRTNTENWYSERGHFTAVNGQQREKEFFLQAAPPPGFPLGFRKKGLRRECLFDFGVLESLVKRGQWQGV